LWLTETSQQPISQTTWLKVTPHCNHCNHNASRVTHSSGWFTLMTHWHFNVEHTHQRALRMIHTYDSLTFQCRAHAPAGFTFAYTSLGAMPTDAATSFAAPSLMQKRVCVCGCVCVCLWVCLWVFVCVCNCLCVIVCRHMRTHTHTHTHVYVSQQT
jgi:hypothetical protein